ncbi:hypothetical protein C8R43DRAFT_1190405 [Mycena crocata]|nr:hypothetical protein C8R43DRAFT_1190405 [Mycena crocata]
MPQLTVRWVSFFALSTALLLSIVSIIGWQSFLEGTKSRNKLDAYGVDVNSDDGANLFTNWTDFEFVLGIGLTIDSFDPNKAGTALGFHLDYLPLNGLAADTNTLIPAPDVPVRLVLDSATRNFPANTIMPTQTVSQILDGDINRYPFDVFTVDYIIYAFTSPDNSSYGTPLPMTVFSEGTVQGFKIETTFLGQEVDGSGVQISFRVSRSPITKAFSIVIILVMWGLSGSVFIAAMSVFFRERKVEPPLIAISTAVLFALPNVRNSQPGIPSVAGTTSDMVGFFFNMLLVAISAFSLILNYIIKNRREKEKESKLPL